MSYPHTNAQALALALANKFSHAAIFDLLKCAQDLNNSIVALPHKNEKGETLVHGSNVRVHSMKDTLTEAVNVLLNTVDRDFAEEICKDFGYHRSTKTFTNQKD